MIYHKQDDEKSYLYNRFYILSSLHNVNETHFARFNIDKINSWAKFFDKRINSMLPQLDDMSSSNIITVFCIIVKQTEMC